MTKVRLFDEQYAYVVGVGIEPDSFDLFEREKVHSKEDKLA